MMEGDSTIRFISRWRTIWCDLTGEQGKASDKKCARYKQRDGYCKFPECCTCAHAQVRKQEVE